MFYILLSYVKQAWFVLIETCYSMKVYVDKIYTKSLRSTSDMHS